MSVPAQIDQVIQLEEALVAGVNQIGIVAMLSLLAMVLAILIIGLTFVINRNNTKLTTATNKTNTDTLNLLGKQISSNEQQVKALERLVDASEKTADAATKQAEQLVKVVETVTEGDKRITTEIKEARDFVDKAAAQRADAMIKHLESIAVQLQTVKEDFARHDDRSRQTQQERKARDEKFDSKIDQILGELAGTRAMIERTLFAPPPVPDRTVVTVTPAAKPYTDGVTTKTPDKDSK